MTIRDETVLHCEIMTILLVIYLVIYQTFVKGVSLFYVIIFYFHVQLVESRCYGQLWDLLKVTSTNRRYFTVVDCRICEVAALNSPNWGSYFCSRKVNKLVTTRAVSDTFQK